MTAQANQLAKQAGDNLTDLDACLKLATKCRELATGDRAKGAWLRLIDKMLERRKIMTGRNNL